MSHDFSSDEDDHQHAQLRQLMEEDPELANKKTRKKPTLKRTYAQYFTPQDFISTLPPPPPPPEKKTLEMYAIPPDGVLNETPKKLAKTDRSPHQNKRKKKIKKRILEMTAVPPTSLSSP
jgi:hypothetical protein